MGEMKRGEEREGRREKWQGRGIKRRGNEGGERERRNKQEVR